MEYLRIKDEFIKLGQALKLCGIAGSGLEAKIMIKNSEVKVNGEICLERGKKLHNEDVFEHKGKEFKVLT